MSYKQLYSMSVLDLIRAGRLIAGTILTASELPGLIRPRPPVLARQWRGVSSRSTVAPVVRAAGCRGAVVRAAGPPRGWAPRCPRRAIRRVSSAEARPWTHDRNPTPTLGGGPSKLAGALRDIPWFGPRAAAWIEGLVANPLQMEQWVLARTGLVVGVIASTAGDLGRLALDAILTLLTLFFFYRGGGELVPETKRAARRLAGDGVDPAIRTLGEAVRAVMYGTLATANHQAPRVQRVAV